jgi:integrase
VAVSAAGKLLRRYLLARARGLSDKKAFELAETARLEEEAATTIGKTPTAAKPVPKPDKRSKRTKKKKIFGFPETNRFAYESPVLGPGVHGPAAPTGHTIKRPLPDLPGGVEGQRLLPFEELGRLPRVTGRGARGDLTKARLSAQQRVGTPAGPGGQWTDTQQRDIVGASRLLDKLLPYGTRQPLNIEEGGRYAAGQPAGTHSGQLPLELEGRQAGSTRVYPDDVAASELPSDIVGGRAVPQRTGREGLRAQGSAELVRHYPRGWTIGDKGVEFVPAATPEGRSTDLIPTAKGGQLDPLQDFYDPGITLPQRGIKGSVGLRDVPEKTIKAIDRPLEVATQPRLPGMTPSSLAQVRKAADTGDKAKFQRGILRAQQSSTDPASVPWARSVSQQRKLERLPDAEPVVDPGTAASRVIRESTRSVQRPRDPGRTLPMEETANLPTETGSVVRLIETALGENDGIQKAAMLAVGAGAGGRKTVDVMRLRRGDYDELRKTLTFRRSKNQKQRVVHLHPRMVSFLEEHLKNIGTGRDTPMFNVSADAVARLVPKLGTKAGMPGVSFHNLRHAYATELFVEQGLSTSDIMKRLGHANEQETIGYIIDAARARAKALTPEQRAALDAQAAKDLETSTVAPHTFAHFDPDAPPTSPTLFRNKNVSGSEISEQFTGTFTTRHEYEHSLFDSQRLRPVSDSEYARQLQESPEFQAEVEALTAQIHALTGTSRVEPSLEATRASLDELATRYASAYDTIEIPKAKSGTLTVDAPLGAPFRQPASEVGLGASDPFVHSMQILHAKSRISPQELAEHVFPHLDPGEVSAVTRALATELALDSRLKGGAMQAIDALNPLELKSSISLFAMQERNTQLLKILTDRFTVVGGVLGRAEINPSAFVGGGMVSKTGRWAKGVKRVRGARKAIKETAILDKGPHPLEELKQAIIDQANGQTGEVARFFGREGNSSARHLNALNEQLMLILAASTGAGIAAGGVHNASN